jgi:alpha-beta hydrolase superfamily lysophospholipase
VRTVSPEPPALGTVDGLSYALFSPAAAPRGAVVICHGADSAKESHYDFARLLRSMGVAAVCFDARGHGDSDGPLDSRVVSDVGSVASVLPHGVPLGLRGSSMGGWLSLAAAASVGASAVVAICPASSSGLASGLRGSRFGFESTPSAADVVAEVDLDTCAAGLGERLLLLHAEGDEVVPVEHSRALHAAARGSRYIELPGGHHRSIQHDAELQAVAARWLLDAFRVPPTP